MQRTSLGIATHIGGTLIVYACALTGMLEPVRVVHYLVGITAVCSLFVLLIRTNVNLRFRDPSMTVAQVVTTMWPAAYVMYHVTLPQARVPFLLMGVVGVLFGVFALNFRRMLLVCGAVLTSYLTVVAALVRWAPERVDLRVEAFSVLAFAVVLVLITYVGTYMADLRRTLRERNARLEEAMAELRDLATHDALTRLLNRRSALERLALAHVAAQEPAVFSVALLDIDHFKKVNDTYGHHVGDAVLRAVADALRETLREEEFAARYGGEEFVVYTRAGTPEQAAVVLERLLAAVRGVSVEGLPVTHRVTASVGLAFHSPHLTVEATLERADRALYQAKQAGRDRAMLADADAAPARVELLVPRG